jgi:predicted nucleotidyltransferase
MIKLVEDRLNEIIVLCEAHKVKSIALFGSASKGSMHDKSDLDFLVQFSDEIPVLDYADNYFSFLEKLEHLLGKKIDPSIRYRSSNKNHQAKLIKWTF